MKVNFGEGETEAIKVTYSSPVGRVGVVWTVPGRMEIMREEEFPTPDARLVIDIVYE